MPVPQKLRQYIRLLQQDNAFTKDIKTMAVVLSRYTPTAVPATLDGEPPAQPAGTAQVSVAAKAARGHRDRTGDPRNKSLPGSLSVAVY